MMLLDGNVIVRLLLLFRLLLLSLTLMLVLFEVLSQQAFALQLFILWTHDTGADAVALLVPL